MQIFQAKYYSIITLEQFMAGEEKMGEESTLKGQFGSCTVPKGRSMPWWYCAGRSAKFMPGQPIGL